ncbi:hypothetical protein K505DRAFT_198692, partial [Melanomma pulvis-pyrius CBS 109.77]
YRSQYPYAYNHELGPVFIILQPAYMEKIFTCGDKVKGRVRVRILTEPLRVTIWFRGRSSCSKDDNTNLFSFTHVLFSGLGPYPRHPNPTYVDFPFEFRFPENVELHPGNINDAAFRSSTMFEHRPGYLLPPSLWAKDGSAKVEYYLEAQIPSDQLFFSGKTKVRHQFRFSPSVIPENYIIPPLIPGSPVLVRRQTRFLDTAGAPKHHSRFSRLKDSINHEDAPSAAFSIAVNLPSQVRVGEPIPLTISLAHLERSEGVLEPPVVSLRGIIAKTIVHIHARVPVRLHPEGEHRCASSEVINLFRCEFKHPGIIMFDGMTLDELSPRLALADSMAPSFRSYGISTTHDLRVKLVVECAGKVSEVDFLRQGITFLPMLRPGSSIPEPMDLP